MPYVDARGIVDIAMRAVRETDPPLFVFVNLLDAHAPYNPPEQALTLLGVLLISAMPGFLPVAAVVPVHGGVQLASNVSRAPQVICPNNTFRIMPIAFLRRSSVSMIARSGAGSSRTR